LGLAFFFGSIISHFRSYQIQQHHVRITTFHQRPFDKWLAEIVRKCGYAREGDGVTLHDKGTLSAQEDRNLAYAQGRTSTVHLINICALPKTKLAREAEIGYQMICMARDFDCSQGNGEEDVNV
jgi:5'-methylthioadenosine phosphorylase